MFCVCVPNVENPNWLLFGFRHCLKSECLDFRHSLYIQLNISNVLSKIFVSLIWAFWLSIILMQRFSMFTHNKKQFFSLWLKHSPFFLNFLRMNYVCICYLFCSLHKLQISFLKDFILLCHQNRFQLYDCSSFRLGFTVCLTS